LIDVDTTHLVSYYKQNDGYAYILGGIDTLTKETDTVAVKTLKANDFVPALDKLFSTLDNSNHVQFLQRVDRRSQ